MIRLLTPNDASELRNLRLSSRQTDPKYFISTYDSIKQLPDHYYVDVITHATFPPSFGIYADFHGNQITTTAQFAREFPTKMTHLANIYELYVKPQHRQQGLASTLIKHLIHLARLNPDLEQLHLRVNSQNTPAIKLYTKLGFKNIAKRKNAIKESPNVYQDELLFCLHLHSR